MKSSDRTTVCDSWMNRANSSNFSQRDFYIIIRNLLIKIIATRTSIKESCELLGGGEQVLPSECDSINKSVQALREQIRSICHLLEQPLNLPIAIFSLRYLPLLSLHHTDEQANQLIPLISELRSICLEPSRHQERQRQKIQNQLESLLIASQDIELQIKMMLDCSRFQASNLKQSLR